MESIREMKLAQLVGPSACMSVRTTILLEGEQLQHFQNMCRQTLAYYPLQEFAPETIDNFLLELERIAVQHGLDRLEAAFIKLRSKPGQRFFPHPTEVAEVIGEEIERERSARARQAQDLRRQKEIDEFWANLPHMLERTGLTEEEFLKRWPSMRGTKPAARTQRAQAANVVTMPSREHKSTAASDDAA